MIINMASAYRGPIYCLMDKAFDIDWFFGNQIGDIKELDLNMLSTACHVDRRNVAGPFYWMSDIVKLLDKPQYDKFLVIGEPFNLSVWSIMLRNRFRRKRKKIYLWSHGWYGREGFAKKWMKRIFFGLADKTFLYGNYARQVAISQGFPADKLEVIHNSLDHDNQIRLREMLCVSDIYHKHFGNADPVLIFIGRLTAVKRLDQLIEAVSILKRQGKDYNIVLVGDGEKRKELEALVKEKGLEKQVWFYGACYDDTQNAQLIYDADLCVAPGNVGLTAMHTMVFGTPVLTHDNYPMQMPEFEAIVPGKTGAFFRYNDVSSLAEEIGNWMESAKGRRDEIRQACFNEIDTLWTPEFQIEVLKREIK